MDLNKDGKDDLQQLRTFIEDVGTDLLETANAAWEWLKAELAKLTARALAVLKSAIQSALASAGAGRPLGEVVADTLTILYREARDIFDEFKSDVVQAMVGLTVARRPVIAS